MSKTKSKIGEDGWPEDQRETLDFEKLVEPLIKATRFCYTLQRKNKDKDVPWKGPNIGRSDRSCCLDADHTLSAANLAYSNDEQGRDALTEILGLAVRLGLEQGRRIFRDSPEFKILVMRAATADADKGRITDEQYIAAITKGEYDVFSTID